MIGQKHRENPSDGLRSDRGISDGLRSDRGSVEAALVMIPTILLFLGVLQLSGNVLSQSVSSNQVQGQISNLALLGSSNSGISSQSPSQPAASGPQSVSNEPLLTQRVPLPGGGYLIVGNKKELAPALSPMIIGHNSYSSIGIAVDENP